MLVLCSCLAQSALEGCAPRQLCLLGCSIRAAINAVHWIGVLLWSAS